METPKHAWATLLTFRRDNFNNGKIKSVGINMTVLAKIARAAWAIRLGQALNDNYDPGDWIERGPMDKDDTE